MHSHAFERLPNDSEALSRHVGSSISLPVIPGIKGDYLLDGFQPINEAIQEYSAIKELDIIGRYVNELLTEGRHTAALGKQHIDKVNWALGNLAPMRHDCAMTVAIPLHNEETTISNWLDAYLSQAPLPTGSVEIVALVNSPAGTVRDRSEEIIQSYCARFNERGISLHVVTHEWDSTRGGVGFARRLLVDIILARIACRGVSGVRTPFLIKHEDADSFGQPIELLSKIQS